MRDSLLALDDSLDFEMGGTLQVELDSYMFKDPYFHPDKTRRRTVYLPLYRNKLPSLLALFDFVDATTTNGIRMDTNIAPQGLYVMNSEFIQDRSLVFAKHLLAQGIDDDRARIEEAYLRSFSRKPRAEEARQAIFFIETYPVAGEEVADPRLSAWQGFCHVLLAANEYHYVD